MVTFVIWGILKGGFLTEMYQTLTDYGILVIGIALLMFLIAIASLQHKSFRTIQTIKAFLSAKKKRFCPMVTPPSTFTEKE